MGPVAKRSVGISIRGNQASFVELEGVAGLVRFRGAGTVEIPQGNGHSLSGSANRAEPAPRSEGLPWKRKPHEVVIGLPRRSVVVRSLELPSLADADLAGLLAYDIERHLPFSPEEACYTFQCLARNRGKAKVLLAAVKRADVERQIEQAARLGLHATAVDVSTFAAANALSYSGREARGTVVCLVEVAGGEAEVSVVKDGLLLSSRGLLLKDTSVEALVREIQRTAGEGAESPARILVSGGDEELCRGLVEALKIPVEPWRPHPECPGASTYGLALKGLRNLPQKVDLLPQERKLRRVPGKGLTVALLVLVGILGVALGLSSAFQGRRVLSELTQRVSAVKSQAEQVEALKAEFTHLNNLSRLLQGLLRDRGKALLVLKELVSLLPADVSLSELSFEGNKVTVRGTTGRSASELIAAFEGSTLFENAAFVSPISSIGKDRQGFHLQAFFTER